MLLCWTVQASRERCEVITEYVAVSSDSSRHVAVSCYRCRPVTQRLWVTLSVSMTHNSLQRSYPLRAISSTLSLISHLDESLQDDQSTAQVRLVSVVSFLLFHRSCDFLQLHGVCPCNARDIMLWNRCLLVSHLARYRLHERRQACHNAL